VINKKTGGGYQFLLKDSEDRPVLWSPRFETKSQCQNGIALLRVQAINNVEFNKWQTDSGRYIFHLKSRSGHLLGMSAPFGSKNECYRHISELQANIADAVEEDLSY